MIYTDSLSSKFVSGFPHVRRTKRSMKHSQMNVDISNTQIADFIIQIRYELKQKVTVISLQLSNQRIFSKKERKYDHYHHHRFFFIVSRMIFVSP